MIYFVEPFEKGGHEMFDEVRTSYYRRKEVARYLQTLRESIIEGK